jgi:hypothetical protein
MVSLASLSFSTYSLSQFLRFSLKLPTFFLSNSPLNSYINGVSSLESTLHALNILILEKKKSLKVRKKIKSQALFRSKAVY